MAVTCYSILMPRLYHFDYKAPFFYMVTLKRLPGLADFSAVGDDGGLVRNALTLAFEEAIRGFHRKWRCIEEISPFAIMPDHIHLMIKIRNTPDRVALGVIVSQLAKALRGEYARVSRAHPCVNAQDAKPDSAGPGVLRGGTSVPPVPASIFGP